jgi:hypothetical protein
MPASAPPSAISSAVLRVRIGRDVSIAEGQRRFALLRDERVLITAKPSAALHVGHLCTERAHRQRQSNQPSVMHALAGWKREGGPTRTRESRRQQRQHSIDVFAAGKAHALCHALPLSVVTVHITQAGAT